MTSLALDSQGMVDATAGLPEQVEAAAAVSEQVGELPDRADITNVLVLGMGGSGVGGDLLVAVAGPFMPVPVVVTKGYEPPSYVDDSTLVFAVSFSGNTEETLDAVTTAANAGGRIIAVTSGGKLGKLAASLDAPVIPVPDDIPQPRAGLGALAIPPLVVLERIGLFPGAGEWIERAVAQLKSRRDELVADGNAAEQLAARIGRTLPLCYGGGHLGLVAAQRWKTQCNENAKVAAFFNTVPELCHNEIVGWGQHGDVTRQVFTAINLRHDHEHPQVMRRFELVSSLIDEVVAGVEEVKAEGDGPLAQLLDLILFGDFMTLHLAGQEGIDPGPIPVLDEIKAALAD